MDFKGQLIDNSANLMLTVFFSMGIFSTFYMGRFFLKKFPRYRPVTVIVLLTLSLLFLQVTLGLIFNYIFPYLFELMSVPIFTGLLFFFYISNQHQQDIAQLWQDFAQQEGLKFIAPRTGCLGLLAFWKRETQNSPTLTEAAKGQLYVKKYTGPPVLYGEIEGRLKSGQELTIQPVIQSGSKTSKGIQMVHLLVQMRTFPQAIYIQPCGKEELKDFDLVMHSRFKYLSKAFEGSTIDLGAELKEVVWVQSNQPQELSARFFDAKRLDALKVFAQLDTLISRILQGRLEILFEVHPENIEKVKTYYKSVIHVIEALD